MPATEPRIREGREPPKAQAPREPQTPGQFREFRPDARAQPAHSPYAGPLIAALLTALGLAVTVWPVSAVVRPGSWSTGAAVTAGAVILAGLLARIFTRRAPTWLAIPAVPIAQLLLGTIALAMFSAQQTESPVPGTGSPTPGTELWDALPTYVAAAIDEIRAGVAPLAATPALAVSIAAAAAAIAVLLDLMLVTLRAALVAGVLITGIGAVPSIAVQSAPDPLWFLALAVLILLFLHVRFAPPGSGNAHSESTDPPLHTRPAVTLLVGALAVVATVVVSPLLPLSAAGLGIGGATSTLSATLNLGQDLRRPTPITALTLITQDGTAPYLRIASLSAFDGRQWQPDRPATVPLSQGFGPVIAPDGVATRSTRTTVRITGIAGSWLPVPYQATAVRGTSGNWTAALDNRTVVAANADAADQNYTIDSTQVVPTLAQIRASTAAGSTAPAGFRDLPATMPAVIAEDAATVIGGASNDYDKLVALQTWFRAGFRYSLQTPVDEGFDGTNVQAIATFLTVREGYCVHFAGAFALMARTLGMPSRIVVGYLPGTATDRRSDDGRVVYEVSTDQLHSWPEVYFAGIGWVPFEPTATRGVPTGFVDPSDGPGTGPTPTAGATPQPTSTSSARDPNRPDIPNPDSAGSSSATPVNLVPVLWAVFAVVVLGLIPAVIRRVQSARRTRRAARGDALAAWAELRAILQDLGLPAPASESPRARGARLVRNRGADPAAVRLLVQAVERASYARAAANSEPVGGIDLRLALDAIRLSLQQSASRRDRITALLAPRSLLGTRLGATSTA